MSTTNHKYSSPQSRLVADDVALTDHALQRYRERTPHETSVSIYQAWRRGEYIRHPEVAGSPGHDVAPNRVRVYRHGNDWGVVMLVVSSQIQSDEYVSNAVATVCALQTLEYGPSRAYLHSHGPHGGTADE